jgi:hypothetical protein
MNLQSLATLGLSVVALAFVVWVALAHPVHESVYGPRPPVAHVATGAGPAKAGTTFAIGTGSSFGLTSLI